ncbi:kynureninase [Pontibacter sp. BT310]|uniref:Kynureninase n=1 Tax=Pontibacter populi TaxID=890055 RepID=A0ABS6X8L5_9BACT|nr:MULTISPECIES: kynureninase [Pontibacter]MBJ6117481.1 kynureninase [Pontibacter sp. BT310]MBR0569906.1 kynureninase [Microvirga sp. STS03]MBW3364334.1 kynureninase [Pontibacter populi]
MNYQNTLAFAQQQDQNDPLHHFRDKFYFPQVNKQDAIYFCGNSLGLQPKSAQMYIDNEMYKWANLAVEGHFKGEEPWFNYHELLAAGAARVVGAKESEVVIMNQLTVNLHLMLVSFYRPEGKRFKIITEAGAFPSDQYALETQTRFHGYNPDEAVVELYPREGEFTLRTEDILQAIKDNADELALVMMGGINYYTGQVFDMEAITKAGHEAGAIVGFDLAHAAGNIPVKLHDWDVDFAVWCTYKYLNSGPGGTSGVFVHERHANNPDLPRFAGWWGHDASSRFQMKKGFIPMPGAAGWQLSNAQILPLAVHRASLELFDEAGMDNMRTKSEKLTGYLEYLINDVHVGKDVLEMITPTDPKARGCQISILVKKNARELFNKLMEAGIIVDYREPNVIRVAPTPLYNSFEEVFLFSEILHKTLEEHQ